MFTQETIDDAIANAITDETIDPINLHIEGYDVMVDPIGCIVSAQRTNALTMHERDTLLQRVAKAGERLFARENATSEYPVNVAWWNVTNVHAFDDSIVGVCAQPVFREHMIGF